MKLRLQGFVGNRAVVPFELNTKKQTPLQKDDTLDAFC